MTGDDKSTKNFQPTDADLEEWWRESVLSDIERIERAEQEEQYERARNGYRCS